MSYLLLESGDVLLLEGDGGLLLEDDAGSDEGGDGVVWLCTAFDPLTNAYLGSVPLGGVTVREGLNARLTVSGRVDLALDGAERRDMLWPGRSKLLVRRLSPLGDLAWSALVWSADYDGRFLSVSAGGVWSAFDQRELTEDLLFGDVDQFVIARALIEWAQTQTGGSVRLGLAPGLSGVVRDRTEYKAFQGQRVGVLVDQLANVIDGFEFEVATTVAAGVPTETWAAAYPRAGRAWAENPIVFTLGTSLGSYSLQMAAPVAAMYSIGAGEGADMKVGVDRRDDLLNESVRLDGSTSYKDVSDHSTLDAHAAADLRKVNESELVWSLRLSPDVETVVPLSSWQVGDDVKVKIPEASEHGVRDFLYPEGTEVFLRVTARTISVSDDGVETVTVETGVARG